jgi:hypothetical protein
MIHFGINFYHFAFNLPLLRNDESFLLIIKSYFFSAHSKLIDESCSIFLQQFEANNAKTNNYGTLIQVFIRLASAVRDECDEYVIIKISTGFSSPIKLILSFFSNIVTWQTYSALYILRCITKYFIEIDSEQNLHPYFLPQDNSGRFIQKKTHFPEVIFL